MKIKLFGSVLEFTLYKDSWQHKVIREVNHHVGRHTPTYEGTPLKIERIKAMRLPHITKICPSDIERDRDGLVSLYYCKLFVETYWQD